MRRALGLVFLMSLATPAYAQTFPPTEIPDDGCTSIPQAGGCEEEEEEEEPNPAPDPAPAPSPAATVEPAPLPTTSATTVPVAPPVTAPSPVAPEPVESLIPPMFIRRNPSPELPAELAYTGVGAGTIVGLLILVVGLIGIGLYARGKGYRRSQ